MNIATEPSANLLREVALTACGRRPGKTDACESCERKAPALLNIASTGAADALAAAICGNQGGACADCRSKAETIIKETADTLCAA